MENKNTVIGIVAISVIFVLFVILLILYLISDPTKVPPASSSEVERLKTEALAGDKDSAEKLSDLKGEKACEAMREVVEGATDVTVKVFCIQGLGRNNKDFESIPMLLNIMDKNDAGSDEDLALRHQAYLAVIVMPGMVDRFYDVRASWDDRQEIVRAYRKDHKYLVDRRANAAAGGGQIGK